MEETLSGGPDGAASLGQPASDEAADRPSPLERGLERATLGVLFVFAVGAPHSIAVTQGAFVAGLILWLARMIVARRVIIARTPLDLAIAVFVGWTLLSVATSYDPATSVSRLKGVSLFLILYLFASNIPSARIAWALSLVLAVASVGGLATSYWGRYWGKGIKIVSMNGSSPLEKWRLRAGDTVLAVDGEPVASLEAFNAAFDRGAPRKPSTIRFMRGEGVLETSYRRKRVRRYGSGPERLGVSVAPGRDYRERAFFSHPVTYAEILQLLGAVAVGWAIAARRRLAWALGMGGLAALIGGALIMTETRASLVSLGIACVAMAMLRGVGRRAGAGLVLGVLLLAGVGTATIYYARRVGFVDMEDQSTTWRLTVWREGFGLLARHPVFGIGPDAAKTHWREWGLFDNGKLPPGHWHSTPLQIAVDRGLPALLAWIAIVAGFVVSAGRLVRRLAAREDRGGDWRSTAAVLGAWGAVIGFLASSMVHFNWGDSEVIEIVWALMGIVYATGRTTGLVGDGERREA